MITIYERNLWPDITQELHPRYMALSDFTVTLEIDEGEVADALEADPLLHQKLIDEVNTFVNDKTYRFLFQKVTQAEAGIALHLNQRDFDSLAADYRSFDEYTRYLLSLTNDNVKYIVGRTITTVAKDKKAVGKYQRGVALKLSVKIAGIAFSVTTIAVGATTAILTGGTTAIPGLVLGIVGLVQSAAELGGEIAKAIESLEAACADAIVSLKDLEKTYLGAGGGKIGRHEVVKGAVNKALSGFVEMNTITTLAGKFDLWESKILVVDQKTHKLARRLPRLFDKADALQRCIQMAASPPVPSRVGCQIKVPPPIPSRAGRPAANAAGAMSPPVPSRRGRVSGSAYKEAFGGNVPPPVPSRAGRMAPPPTPPPSTVRDATNQAGDPRTNKTMKLARVRASIMKIIPEIEKLQAEVTLNKRRNQYYTTALNKLKGRKPEIAEFVEAFNNVALDLTKSGLGLAAGSLDLYDGLKSAKLATESIHTIGSFVVEQCLESATLANDLADGFGELSKTLNEKDKLARDARRSHV